MATASQARSESKLSLEIRTKSIEQTLVPLVTQITTLVNHKENTRKSDKTLRALVRVGQAVNLAVERFVTVGESIAEENPEIRHDMCEACKDARLAGNAIQRLTEQSAADPAATTTVAEKTAMVRAARQLLSAITKVLLMADRIVVKQLIAARDKVLVSMNKIEGVNNFTDFVKAFSTFGQQMVELAHLTGDRQNDLKSEKQRAQMGVARIILEKSTMMLLTTSKAYLRHPECSSARTNRDGVFTQMRRALDMIHHVVTDGVPQDGDKSPTPPANGDSGISLAQHQSTASKALKEFDDLVDMTRMTLVGPNTEGKLQNALETMIETTQDFTDSAYTSHENRERILRLCERVRQELTILLRIGISLDQKDNNSPNQELETAIIKTKDSSKTLRKQLNNTAMDHASDLFKSNEDHDLLNQLKTSGMNGESDRVNETSVKFQEHSEQLQEVCKLMRHICTTEPLIVWTEHAEASLRCYGPQAISAAQTLAQHPTSKIARENLDVFADAWAAQINDLSVLVKDINDMCQGKSERQVYMSLPRPGGYFPRTRSQIFYPDDFYESQKHGTTAKSMRPVKLSAEEQAKIAKLGLEMKLITSEIDAEAEKWEEPDNEIVRRSKNMSSMAFSMYLFTRGEGPLKTTQDLFTQAEYFAEEGTKLFKTVKDFTQIVPPGTPKNDLLCNLDKLPVYCQQLNFTIKSPTVGKAATFNKVDSVIQETKNLMNAVAKVVTTCFICATKYNIDYRGAPQVVTKWRTPHYDLNGSGPGSDGSDRDSVKSGRSENLMRSSSLNKASLGGMSYDRL